MEKIMKTITDLVLENKERFLEEDKGAVRKFFENKKYVSVEVKGKPEDIKKELRETMGFEVRSSAVVGDLFCWYYDGFSLVLDLNNLTIRLVRK